MSISSIDIALLSCLLLLLYALFEEKKKKANLEVEVAKLVEKVSRIMPLEDELACKTEEVEALRIEKTTLSILLQEEKKKSDERVALLAKAEETLKNAFKAASIDALKESRASFFDLAKETFDAYKTGIAVDIKEKNTALENLVKPLHESLGKVDNKLQELERARIAAYVSVAEQLKAVSVAHLKLQTETSNLVKALRMPHVRGRWGELQLRRVVEMAGMVEHCDFIAQAQVGSDDTRLRPDLIIRLPNARSIIIDAKAPLQAYLEAIEATDEEVKKQWFADHARQMRRHIGQLAEKCYWDQVVSTPEFVVLFLPGEAFFSAALEADPALIEYGVDKKVIVATPTTLIALLRSVAYGWQEKAIAEHAEQISTLGKGLYDRLVTLLKHFQKLKRSLDATCESYNDVVGCLESRVIVSARRFKELKVVENKADVESPGRSEKTIREPDLLLLAQEDEVQCSIE